MDHLTKQQLVLLALLLSFVTSLATGIVTVSLMDQAPQGVTRTVSQVIEKTIQQVSAPESASVGTVTLSVDDQLANAAAKVSSSLVKIEDIHSNSIVGLGLVVSTGGTIITDKSVVSQSSNYQAVFSDGITIPIIVMSISAATPQTNGQVVFLEPSPSASVSSSAEFTPIVNATSFTLGQSVFSLAGTSTAILGQGVITDMAGLSSMAASSTVSPSLIGTSISMDRVTAGSPVFDIRGNIIGIRTSSFSGVPDGSDASFEPIAPLLSGIQVVK